MCRLAYLFLYFDIKGFTLCHFAPFYILKNIELNVQNLSRTVIFMYSLVVYNLQRVKLVWPTCSAHSGFFMQSSQRKIRMTYFWVLQTSEDLLPAPWWINVFCQLELLVGVFSTAYDLCQWKTELDLVFGIKNISIHTNNRLIQHVVKSRKILKVTVDHFWRISLIFTPIE